MKKILVALVGCITITTVLQTEAGVLQTHKKKLGLLGSLLAHISLRKCSSSYKKFSDKIYSTAKDTVLHKVVVPVVDKLERVKDEGVSQHDVILTNAVVGSTAGLIYHLGLLHPDMETIRSILSNDYKFMRNHKPLVALVF